MHYSNVSRSKPTILFLHGFPSSSFDWRRQFDYFSSKGYAIIAPDMLGYGGSSKPLDPGEYTLKKQARDMVELLNCVGTDETVVVGHDLYAY